MRREQVVLTEDLLLVFDGEDEGPDAAPPLAHAPNPLGDTVLGPSATSQDYSDAASLSSKSKLGEMDAGPRVHPTTTGGVDGLSLLAAYRSWLEAGYAPPTVKTYWGALRQFVFANPKALASYTEDDVTAFLAQFPYRSSARRTYYQALHLVFGWACRRGDVLVDPTAAVRVPAVVEKVPRALSETELERIVEAARRRAPYRAAAILLLYHSGARLDEAVNIRWSDVHDDALLLCKTKGGREREVPMTPKLRAVLDELWVWSGTFERVLPRAAGTIWIWVREAGRDAGVDHVHPHLLRSTFATRMLVRGARPHAVKELLGHVNIRTTQRYWAVEAEDMQAAVDLL